MKVFVLAIVTFLATTSFAAVKNDKGQFDQQIVGTWEFYKVFYDGQERPPFNPKLKLYFEFNEDGESRLYYFRTNEEGFCERRGRYYVEGEILIDKVTWSNPDNNIGCGQDPDMRVGNETRTQIDFQGKDFYLYLSLKGEPLIYIWRTGKIDN